MTGHPAGSTAVKNPSRALACVFLILVLAAAAPLMAQSVARSQLEGRITDASGLPIARARITVAGPKLFGGGVDVESESQGEYRIAGLPPGTYDLRVKAPGFEAATRPGVVLPAGATYVIDVRMAVATIEDRVHVVAAAPAVDVRTSAVTSTFDRHLLESLPTDRTLRSVLNLAPGVTRDVAFGGAAETSNVFALDGVRLMEPYLGRQTVQVGYTWADQVQVRALGAPAEVGQFTGAIANTVVRSGSNRFSGLGEVVSAIPGWTGENTGGLSEDLQRQFVAEDIIASWELSAQAGGPIVRDRLWFFAGLSANDNERRPFGYGGPDSIDERAPRWIAKLDAAPAGRVRLHGFYGGDRATTTAALLGAFTPVEAAGDARRRNHTWSVGATWAPDGQTLVELRNGGLTGEERLDPHPPASRSGPPGRYDLETEVFTDNIVGWYVTGSTAVTTAASVERFARWWGEHQLKGGIESEYTATSEDDGFPGGLFFNDMSGVPLQVLAWDGYREHTTTWRTSLFVKDRWTFGRFSFEPGLRVERNRGSVPGRPGAFATSPVGWRVGAAWDVTADHRTVIRAHHGRYFDPVFNYLYSFNDVTGRNETVTYDITASGEWVEADRFTSSFFPTMLPDLKQARVDQFVAGVERQVLGDVSAELRYVHRAFRDFIGFVDLRLSEWRPVTTEDPGPDGVLATADDAGPITYYRPYAGKRALGLGNVPGAHRDYDAVQVLATKRLSARWQGQVSYTWSRSTGTLPNLDASNTGFRGTGQSGVGANRNFHSSRPGEIRPTFDFSEAKALGVYDAPWLGGFSVSGVYRWQNGARWERVFLSSQRPFVTVRAEPLGSRRAPSVGTLDVRVDKRLPIGAGRRAAVYLDVFNVANTGKALSLQTQSGPFFGEPAAWTTPRTVRVGARITFD
jgi:hypothetical protein